MITSKEAGEVALKYGLSLPDAAALARMADDTAEADVLAKMFSEPAAPRQLTRDDVKNMKPDEIVQAKADGRLDDLLSPKANPAGPRDELRPFTRDDLKQMSATEITEARAAGLLNHLLSGDSQ